MSFFVPARPASRGLGARHSGGAPEKPARPALRATSAAFTPDFLDRAPSFHSADRIDFNSSSRTRLELARAVQPIGPHILFEIKDRPRCTVARLEGDDFLRLAKWETTRGAIRSAARRWERPPRRAGRGGSRRRTRRQSTESASRQDPRVDDGDVQFEVCARVRAAATPQQPHHSFY